MMSKCKYPTCEPGQYGTHCHKECLESVFDQADREFVRFNLIVLAAGLALCVAVAAMVLIR